MRNEDLDLIDTARKALGESRSEYVVMAALRRAEGISAETMREWLEEKKSQGSEVTIYTSLVPGAPEHINAGVLAVKNDYVALYIGKKNAIVNIPLATIKMFH